MRFRRWFLPQSADVLGMLSEQAAITEEGMEALAAWAGGEEAAAERLRLLEHGPIKTSASCAGADRGLLDAAGAGGPVRAVDAASTR